MKNKFPQLSDTEIHLLVKNTRGFRQDDIIKACGQYITTNERPSLIAHPTNTCDPISGSWTERFLSYAEYKSLFNRHGYALSITYGFYNQYQGGIKGAILFFLNIVIKMPGRTGNMISPYIMLTGNGSKQK